VITNDSRCRARSGQVDEYGSDVERFFESLPPAADEPPGASYRTPPWLAPPRGTLPGVVALERVLARTELAAVCVTRLGAYPTGFEMELVTLSSSMADDLDPLLFGPPRRRHGSEAEGLPDEMLRFGVQFADGSKATNVGGDRPYDPAVAPAGPVIVPVAEAAAAGAGANRCGCGRCRRRGRCCSSASGPRPASRLRAPRSTLVSSSMRANARRSSSRTTTCAILRPAPVHRRSRTLADRPRTSWSRPMEVTIRDATEGDADAVAALLADLGYPTSRDAAAARVARFACEPASRLQVADSADGVVGLVATHMIPRLDDDRCSCRITDLVVAASHRRRGVGSALIAAAEREARRSGVPRLDLSSGEWREDA